MSPVWLIEGGAAIAEPEVPSDEAAANGGKTRRFPSSTDERLSALAAAVRDHESRGRHAAMPARPEDLTLYRRLRQICGER
jgi:hypothetical protein